MFTKMFIVVLPPSNSIMDDFNFFVLVPSILKKNTNVRFHILNIKTEVQRNIYNLI